MNTTVPQGSRKATDARTTGWQLVLVFAMWLVAFYFAKAPEAVLWTICGFLVGKQTVLAASNVAVHRTKANNEPKGETANV